jgi:hypothetical protein
MTGEVLMCNAHNHPPGCTCGWGGFGSSGGGSLIYNFRNVFNEWMPDEFNKQHSDFCAEVNCRDCGELTYLIHHNGGYVLVDELGWPWPIHPCYEKKRLECALSDEEDRCYKDFTKFKDYSQSKFLESQIELFVVSEYLIWGKGHYLLLNDLNGKASFEIFVDSKSDFSNGRILGVCRKSELIVTPFRKPIKYYPIHNDDASLPNFEDIDQTVAPKLYSITDYSSPVRVYGRRRRRTFDYDKRHFIEIQIKPKSPNLSETANERIIISEEFLSDVIEINDDKCCFKSEAERAITESLRKELVSDFNRLLFQKNMDDISESEFKKKKHRLFSGIKIKFSDDGKEINFVEI